MNSRVTRDGDTVTVRCSRPTWGGEVVFERSRIDDQVAVVARCDGQVAPIVITTPDLAALADHLQSLAGEPDWRALAVKLRRLDLARWLMDDESSSHAERTERLRDARAAITAEEWAAVEGAGDE